MNAPPRYKSVFDVSTALDADYTEKVIGRLFNKSHEYLRQVRI